MTFWGPNVGSWIQLHSYRHFQAYILPQTSDVGHGTSMVRTLTFTNNCHASTLTNNCHHTVVTKSFTPHIVDARILKLTTTMHHAQRSWNRTHEATAFVVDDRWLSWTIVDSRGNVGNYFDWRHALTKKHDETNFSTTRVMDFIKIWITTTMRKCQDELSTPGDYSNGDLKHSETLQSNSARLNGPSWLFFSLRLPIQPHKHCY